MKRKTSIYRIVSLLLALILVTTGFTGCKKNNPKPDPSQQEQQQQEEQEEPAASQTGDSAEEPAAEPVEEPAAEPAAESAESSNNDENEQIPVEVGESEEPAAEPAEEPDEGLVVYEDELYYTKDEVALYLHDFGHLPDNYMTKKEAKKLGWSGGSLEKFAPGKVIGGDRFGNYEGLLPDDKGQKYYECDIDTLGKKKRGAKRIIWGDDGSIYYTEDHYESFELLYEGT